jgi:hypothetical protein
MSREITWKVSMKISEVIRTQGLVFGMATSISLLLIVLSYLESRQILSQGTSVATLYATIFLVWPFLGSLSGALMPISNGRFIKRTAMGFMQLLMALFLASIGLATVLGVLKNVRLNFGYGLPGTLEFLASQFKDTGYLHMSDGSDLLEKIWSSRGEHKLLLGILVSILCFSCARLFSRILSRAKIAAIAGCLAGMSIFGIVVHCWIRLDLFGFDCTGTREPGELEWILGVLALSSLLIHFSAVVIAKDFHWPAGKSIWVGSLVSAVLASIAFFTFAYPHSIRLSPQSALAMWQPLVAHDGKAAIVTAVKRESYAPQVWSISLKSKNIRRLDGRMADHPFLSPDGNWVGYLSQRNLLGLTRDSVDLRVIRLDGTEDRLLASQLTANHDPTQVECGAFAFSPDSSRAAIVCNDTLVVAELNSGHSIRTPLPALRCGAWLVAWNSFGSEVLVAPDPPTSIKSGPLVACNPLTGRIRTIRKNDEGNHHFIFPSSTKGIPLVFFGNSILDLTNDKEQRITESDCYAAGLSDDQKLLVYATASNLYQQNTRTEVHWRELASGRDEMVASFPGILSEPFLVSPAGNRVITNDNSEPMHDRAIIIERTGTMREFSSGWMAFGWMHNNKVVLLKPLEKSIPLAIGDAETMIMRVVRP